MHKFTESEVSANLAALPTMTEEQHRVSGKSLLNSQIMFYALTKALYTDEELHQMLIEFKLENPEEEDA